MFTVFNYKYKRQRSHAFYCKLILATPTVIYATYNLTAFPYGEDVGGEQVCIRIRVANNVEDFLNMYLASYNF